MEKVGSCLFNSGVHIFLIGVEGFPHSCFRHFIRNVNLRGITPDVQGVQQDNKAERTQSGKVGGE